MTSYSDDDDDDLLEDSDSLPPIWGPPTCFCEARHTEPIRAVVGQEQAWRMKERAKTTSVAIVLCLNVGVDPPDIIKTQPCAKLEGWIDPLAMAPQKALEGIANQLQKQYERWQPRARYKQSLDPTVDEVKKLCTSLRRNSKHDRVLFHYNGHGVPKPTVNGELWVFNKSYTQYIPLSLYDLQQWMSAPSIYVYDCSNAGQIVESFSQFAVQRDREIDLNIHPQDVVGEEILKPDYKRCIQLASCGKDEVLPMSPDLPADLFTACLTTPIRIALQWFIKHNSGKLLPGVTLELLERIPGSLTDRRTMLGELNWIFTAVTDTIAWNVLPNRLFQELFRQDLLVASLFRNFLLADRIMRSYNCSCVSSPELPLTSHHPMWQAWDLAVDVCLSQLPRLLQNPNATYIHSTFFSEQLTAFQVWLSLGKHEQSQPDQLPIVLQVLLSQVHRLRALDLLSQFLDLGPWAVNLSLSVGIFPYVLKLLQSLANELRPNLVQIWAKILAVEGSCQVDLVKDGGHKYFIALLSESSVLAHHKAMAAFVSAMIVRNYPIGQEAAFQGNLIAICLEQLTDSNNLLRRWLCICLGLVWERYEKAYWRGVRDLAHEKLLALLEEEPEPEVRAAAVFALGTFINSASERTDQVNAINLRLGISLITKAEVLSDGSPLVRKELVVALQWLVIQFENHFVTLQYQMDNDDRNAQGSPQAQSGSDVSGTPPLRNLSSRDHPVRVCPNSAKQSANNIPSVSFANQSSSQDFLSPPQAMRRISSMSSINGQVRAEYKTIWKAVHILSTDPDSDVSRLAESIIDEIKSRVHFTHHTDAISSQPASPCNGNKFEISDSPPNPRTLAAGESRSSLPGATYCAKRRFNDSNTDAESTTSSRQSFVSTEFVSWSAQHYTKPILKPGDWDREGHEHQKREYDFAMQLKLSEDAKEELNRIDATRIEDQVFLQRNTGRPRAIRINPFEPYLVAAEKDSFTVWSWEGLRSRDKLSAVPVIHSHTKNRTGPSNGFNTSICSLELMNVETSMLVALTSEDSSVRIWSLDPSTCDADGTRVKPKLVSAFNLFRDYASLRESFPIKTVVHWEQESSQMIAGAKSSSVSANKYIRIWDAQQERIIRNIRTDCDQGVTNIDSDGQWLICASCQDGSVRIFDRREKNDRVRTITFREHVSPVTNAHLFPEDTHVFVLSASTNGEVKFWDKRMVTSIKTINTQQDISAMVVHEEADVFACGSSIVGNQAVGIYSLDGIAGSAIRFYEGFMGQRVGPVSCLAFHPLRPLLVVGTNESFISIYSARSQMN